jgi:drug/metabolite transporter (DMT)-like permease
MGKPLPEEPVPKSLMAQPWVLWALAVVYVFWGTSYLAIKQAGDDFPPLLLVGLRNLLAGGLMLLLSWMLKRPFGTLRQGMNASCVGYVESGFAAMLFATVPVAVCLMVAVTGSRIGLMQWLGTLVGVLGLVLMNKDIDGSLQSTGMWLILAAVIATAASAVMMDRMPMPGDLIVATGVQMVAGGAVACIVGWMLGERIEEVGFPAWMAWLYLSLMVSVLGYMSYTYLLLKTGPVLASSYAYVNPPVALLAGAAMLGESVTSSGFFSMILVLLGAMIVLWGTPVQQSKASSRADRFMKKEKT